MAILSRTSKGQGVIRDIKHILDGIYFGSSYFEAMTLLRDSMLMSVITHNIEVCFNLTPNELKMLHDIDLQLLRVCLQVGQKKQPESDVPWVGYHYCPLPVEEEETHVSSPSANHWQVFIGQQSL